MSTDIQSSVTIPIDDDDQHGVPFSEAELEIMYNHLDIPIIQAAVIMCYSGWRITEFLTLDINLDDMTFFGGVKTEAGIDRIVPIHAGIAPLVQLYTSQQPIYSKDSFRKNWDTVMNDLGILWTETRKGRKVKKAKHTSHDCRHTFSWLCDKYKVDPISKRMMIGHKLGKDVTDNTYGHRTTDELREEISKIKVPESVTNL